MAKDELDQLGGANIEHITATVGKRIATALESIDKRLAELNETLSGVVGEYAVDPSNILKTVAVLRTFQMKP